MEAEACAADVAEPRWASAWTRGGLLSLGSLRSGRSRVGFATHLRDAWQS